MSTTEYGKCAVCEMPMSEARAYMNIKYQEEWVRLCCPLCYDTFNKRKDFYMLRNKAFEAAEKIKGNQ